MQRLTHLHLVGKCAGEHRNKTEGTQGQPRVGQAAGQVWAVCSGAGLFMGMTSQKTESAHRAPLPSHNPSVRWPTRSVGLSLRARWQNGSRWAGCGRARCVV